MKHMRPLSPFREVLLHQALAEIDRTREAYFAACDRYYAMHPCDPGAERWAALRGTSAVNSPDFGDDETDPRFDDSPMFREQAV